MSKYNWLNQEPSTPEYVQPETHEVIEFKNYQNIEYDFVVEDSAKVEDGCSFRELLARGFEVNEVNIHRDLKYGFGRKLIPKTQAINDMKETIDSATELLQDSLNTEPEVKDPVVDTDIKKEVNDNVQ